MDNYCINTLPRHNCQHELEPDNLIIIQTIWNSDSIRISLSVSNSKHKEFTGTLATSALSITADTLEINLSAFMEETRMALCSENGLTNFTYCLEQCEEHNLFQWYKATELGIRVRYGSVILETIANVNEEMLMNALKINKMKDEKIEKQKREIQLMDSDFKQMKMSLDKCIAEKDNLENKLLSKFVALLNTKKEKIVELKLALENRTTAVGDYESDGSDDDSDLEYSSQSYIVPVKTPPPSTSRNTHDDVVVVPKRIKPAKEGQLIQEVQQIQSKNSTDSSDVYDRETEILIDEM